MIYYFLNNFLINGHINVQLSPDPLFKITDVWIWIRKKYLRIRNTYLLRACLYIRLFFNLFKTRWTFLLLLFPV